MTTDGEPKQRGLRSPHPYAERSRRGPVTWLIVAGLVLMTAIAVGTGLAIERFRQDAIKDGRQGLESAVLLLQRHFDRQFEDFSILQNNIAAELESHGIESPDVFSSEMSTLAIHERIRAQYSGWADVAGANLFDADGVLINSTQRWPVADVRVSDRAYTVTGCEALLRWRHPERGMISPAEFIPVAEETGMINEIGEWVLKRACAEAVGWPAHVVLAVNVSPVQFKSKTLALRVATALESSGLSPSRLEIEVTEAVLIRDDEEALTILHQLRDLGVRIALDDFGTGYSSLSYLRRFPFDKIKIDRSFVKDIEHGDGSSTIVQAVVNMASACRMSTTAEGVETEAQREILRQLGCSQMQGFLFSPAVPAQQLSPLISKTTMAA